MDGTAGAMKLTKSEMNMDLLFLLYRQMAFEALVTVCDMPKNDETFNITASFDMSFQELIDCDVPLFQWGEAVRHDALEYAKSL